LAVSVDRDTVAGEVLAELARSRSTWTRAQVVREAPRRAPTGFGTAEATRAWIEAVTETVIA
jgi:hypothetical protein